MTDGANGPEKSRTPPCPPGPIALFSITVIGENGSAPRRDFLTPHARAPHYMPTTPNLHLKGFRKRSGLTQADVARLMGRISPSPISRLENGEQRPDFRSALLLEIILGAPAHKMFRRDFETLAKKVLDQAILLDERLKLSAETPDIKRRRTELKAIVARIDRTLA